MSATSIRPQIPRPTTRPAEPKGELKTPGEVDRKSEPPPAPASSVRSVVPRPIVAKPTLEIELADDDVIEAAEPPTPSKMPPPPPPVAKKSEVPKAPRVPNFDAMMAPKPAWEVAPAHAPASIRPAPIVGIGTRSDESEPARSTLTPPPPVLDNQPIDPRKLETWRPESKRLKAADVAIEGMKASEPPPKSQVISKPPPVPQKQPAPNAIVANIPKAPPSTPAAPATPRAPLPMPVLSNLVNPAPKPQAVAAATIAPATTPPPAAVAITTPPPAVTPTMPSPAPVSAPPPVAVAPVAPPPAPMPAMPTNVMPMRAPAPSIVKTFGSLTDPTDILFDVLCELDFADTAKGAAQMCAEGLVRALGARAVLVHMHDDGHHELRTIAAHGPRTAALVGSTEPSEDDFVGGAVLCNGKPVTMTFDGELPMLAPRRLRVIGVNRGLVAVPAMIWKRCVAIIEVIDPDDRYAPRAADSALYVAKRLAEYLVQRAAA